MSSESMPKALNSDSAEWQVMGVKVQGLSTVRLEGNYGSKKGDGRVCKDLYHDGKRTQGREALGFLTKAEQWQGQ